MVFGMPPTSTSWDRGQQRSNGPCEGHGCHDNGKPEIDADLAGAKFVGFLRGLGHQIFAAAFSLTSTPKSLMSKP